MNIADLGGITARFDTSARVNVHHYHHKTQKLSGLQRLFFRIPHPTPKQQVRFMFFDRCYHLPFLSQAELVEEEGDEGLSHVSHFSVRDLGCLGGYMDGKRSSDRWQLPIKQLSEVQSISSSSSSTSVQSMSWFIWHNEKKVYNRKYEPRVTTCQSFTQLFNMT